MIERNVNRKPCRVTIGRYGAWTLKQARDEARKLRVLMDQGVDPNAKRKEERARRERETKRTVTLSEALALKIKSMRDHSPRTIDGMRYHLDKYLSDWANRQLATITRAEVAARHEQLTEKNGPIIANHVLRTFRSTYNHALKQNEHLPANPCVAVTFNKEHTRQQEINWKDLPNWWRKTGELSPVRRDYMRFVLLTGLRRTDAATITWEDIDWSEGTLHRPNPKGGRDMAFTIPLSMKALAILRLRRMQNPIIFDVHGGDHGLAFPTVTRSSPKRVIALAEPKEKGLPHIHQLRHLYTSACAEVELHPFVIDVLTNHRPPKGTLSAGYTMLTIERLRVSQEKVTAFLMGIVENCQSLTRV